MLVLIWAALLFCSAKSETGTSQKGNKTCDTSITLSEGNITAEAGLCVVIPCSFTNPTKVKHKFRVWFKESAGSKERVALLDPDLAQKNNCSVIINDLTESGSGSYKITAETTETHCAYSETTVIVKALSQKPKVTFPPLTEGQHTTLTCTAPGRCSGSPPAFIWTWRGTGGNVSEIAYNTTCMRTVNLNAVTVEHSSTLTFIPSAKHHGTNITCKVRFIHNLTTEETVALKVNYVKTPKITGNTCMKEGDTLNLTCHVESYPQSTVKWTKSGKYLNGTQTTTLVIPNVTAEHSGLYICTAQQPNSTQTVNASTTVIFCPKILNGSECVTQSDVVTCVCISQGVPLPSITWSLFENHTQYSIITTASGSTVNSTITLPAKYSNTSIECVSSNGVLREVRRNFTIGNNKPEQDLYKEVLRIVTQLETIIAFLIGVVLSATICCLTRRCCRKKQKNSRNLSETLEMVTSQDQPADAGQAMEDPTHRQEAPQGRNESGAQSSEAVVKSGTDGELTDADYASIDYSLLKKKRAEEAEKNREITETEYAEIKREDKEEVQEDGGEESQMLKEEEEEEATLGGDEETKHLEEEAGEGVALYSNVKAEEG